MPCVARIIPHGHIQEAANPGLGGFLEEFLLVDPHNKVLHHEKFYILPDFFHWKQKRIQLVNLGTQNTYIPMETNADTPMAVSRDPVLLT